VGEHVVHLPRDPLALGDPGEPACSSRLRSARSARPRSEASSWRRARMNMPPALAGGWRVLHRPVDA
jgi:hypothetical protein